MDCQVGQRLRPVSNCRKQDGEGKMPVPHQTDDDSRFGFACLSFQVSNSSIARTTPVVRRHTAARDTGPAAANPVAASRSCAAKISPLPGILVCATTSPAPVTACEMPELASAENWNAVFRRAHGCAARMQLVLVPAPVFHVHRRDDEQLRALAHQFVRHARVAQVVADADADFAPRRIPDFLFLRGQAVLETLDRHAFGLLKNDVAVRADDEGGVVKNIVCRQNLFRRRSG